MSKPSKTTLQTIIIYILATLSIISVYYNIRSNNNEQNHNKLLITNFVRQTKYNINEISNIHNNKSINSIMYLTPYYRSVYNLGKVIFINPKQAFAINGINTFTSQINSYKMLLQTEDDNLSIKMKGLLKTKIKNTYPKIILNNYKNLVCTLKERNIYKNFKDFCKGYK